MLKTGNLLILHGTSLALEPLNPPNPQAYGTPLAHEQFRVKMFPRSLGNPEKKDRRGAGPLKGFSREKAYTIKLTA
ncbi:MAG: hypothetical protein JNL98_21285 [Bryobacterales bacterium]|nr:hypothetical protein [Bryobacterales bacterium]